MVCVRRDAGNHKKKTWKEKTLNPTTKGILAAAVPSGVAARLRASGLQQILPFLLKDIRGMSLIGEKKSYNFILFKGSASVFNGRGSRL